jgi:HSP20 family protein
MASRYLAPAGRSAQAPALPSAFSTFRSLQQGMDSMLANMLRGGGQGDGSGVAQLLSPPRMDVEEREDEYCVTAELPGLSDGDVEVTVEDDLLVISGEKREEHEREAGDRRIVEREFGRFRRAVQLPFAPDPERIRAEIRDGLLTIHIPKEEEGRTHAHRIEVRRQDQAPGQLEGSGQDQGSGQPAPGAEGAGSTRSESGEAASERQPEERAAETADA